MVYTPLYYEPTFDRKPPIQIHSKYFGNICPDIQPPVELPEDWKFWDENLHPELKEERRENERKAELKAFEEWKKNRPKPFNLFEPSTWKNIKPKKTPDFYGLNVSFYRKCINTGEITFEKWKKAIKKLKRSLTGDKCRECRSRGGCHIYCKYSTEGPEVVTLEEFTEAYWRNPKYDGFICGNNAIYLRYFPNIDQLEIPSRAIHNLLTATERRVIKNLYFTYYKDQSHLPRVKITRWYKFKIRWNKLKYKLFGIPIPPKPPLTVDCSYFDHKRLTIHNNSIEALNRKEAILWYMYAAEEKVRAGRTFKMSPQRLTKIILKSAGVPVEKFKHHKDRGPASITVD